jgi:hypothetical protein
MKYKSCLFFLLYFQFCISQNLVNNPSFEDYSQCPIDNSFFATDWYRIMNHYGTVDYLNICAPYSYVSVPTSMFGYQEPNDGNGYIGMSCYYPANSLREYVQTRLISPLIADEYYEISFFTCLTDISSHAINNIGAFLSNIAITGNNDYEALNLIPQINSSVIISDKINWTQIKAVYHAIGGEEFLTLGNFYSDQNTSKTVLSSSGDQLCYYLIDNVKVTKTDKPETESNCIAFSNPVYETLHIENLGNIQLSEIVIVDMSGKMIDRKIIDTDIYVGDLQDGVYIVHYICEGRNQCKKFIKL